MMNRRDILKTLAAAGAVLPFNATAFAAAEKYGIKQSVCLWCYGGYLGSKGLTLEDFCKYCQELGLKSIELTGPGEWETMKKYGLICAMVPSGGIGWGFNRVENHAALIENTKQAIDRAADAGYPNVICFSGNCEGMDKKEGLKNCVVGLKEVVPYAKEKGIILNLEFLNSHGHKDYMADTTDWCVEVVHEVADDNFKVLYDIYHAAEMGENPLEDIRKHHLCWGHYHTGGYPGRAEIDKESQKLDYAELMQAIAETGYKMYVGQEFCPRRDAFQSLKEAVELCDV